MSKATAAIGVFKTKFRRWWNTFSLFPAILQVVVLVAIVGQSVSPDMRVEGESWISLKSWKKSLPSTIPLILCVAYLRYEEKFRKFFGKDKLSHIWKVRMADLAKLL